MTVGIDRNIFVLTLVVLCGATTKPSSVLDNAVAALVAEYQAVLKDAEKPIRVECDFFKQNPPSVPISPANVLPHLERTGGDVRVESYVKWQLLSAIDGKLEDTNAARAIAIYRRSPSLMLRPGVTALDRIELDKLAAGQTQDAHERVDQKLIDKLGPFNAYNAQTLRYRNDLYARLPVRYETLLAGYDDAAERLAKGIDDVDVKPFLESLVADTREWIATKPDAKQRAAISKVVNTLAQTNGPMHYTGVSWSKRQRRLIWSTAQRDLNFDNQLKQLASDLKEQLP